METEKSIINRLRRGDTLAMKALMNIHQDYVYTLVYRMVKSHVVAEELSQDVFIKVYKKIDTYQEKAKFSTWLYTISYRTCLNYLEKKKIVFNMTELENSTNDTSENMSEIPVFEKSNFSEDSDLKEILWDAIDLISQAQGVIITLYYLQQFSLKEISEMMDVTQNTVKINLFRARKSLKSILLKSYSQEELI